MKIEELEISQEVYSKLITGNIKTVEDAMATSMDKLRELGLSDGDLFNLGSAIKDKQRDLELLAAVKKVGPVMDNFIERLRSGEFG